MAGMDPSPRFLTSGLAVLALIMALPSIPVGAAPEIRGVYALKLGQTRSEARGALETDNHFRPIAGREFRGFPLYEVTLGGHELRVRPVFREDRLVEIALRFRRDASANDVGPVLHDQLRFGVETLSARFGEPDRAHFVIREIDRRDFVDGERVPTHEWVRGERVARLMLWQERFTYGVEIVLAELRAENQGESAAEAF